MLTLGTVQRGADAPPYRQIAAHLRLVIDRGELRPGDKLPSESELLSHYGVARMTIRQALAELRAEGLVVAEHGRGVFVRSRPPIRRSAADRFARRHRLAGRAAFLAEVQGRGTPSVDELEIMESVPPQRVRQLLGSNARARSVIRSRRYLIDGEPIELAVSYVPAAIARGTKIAEPDSGPGGIYARLEELGHTLVEFVEEVTARMPTPGERRRLSLGPGVPVMTVLRSAVDVHGHVVEVCDTVKPGPGYVLEYRIPAV